jgi:hypothetical protein
MPRDEDDDSPVIQVTSRAQVVKRRPIDAVSRGVYLDVLRRTGSRAAAAAAARPHLRTKASAMSAFENHMETNPTFLAAVMDAEAEMAGQLDEEIRRRAMEGVVTFEKKDAEGNVLERRVEHDNKLLVQVARNVGKRVNPSAWAPDDKRVVVEGGTRNVNLSMDIDRMLEDMPSEAIAALVSAAEKAKTRALTAGPVAEDIEDAEIVESSLDNGSKGN